MQLEIFKCTLSKVEVLHNLYRHNMKSKNKYGYMIIGRGLILTLFGLIFRRIYNNIKSKGIYQPENVMCNGSSRHDDAAQTK